MKFRPCIDIHNGKVKQLVGGSLKDEGNSAKENFVSDKDSTYFSDMYKNDRLKGGHIIILNSKDSEFFEASKKQAEEALSIYKGGMQVGGGITNENALEYIEIGASHVVVTSFVFKDGKIDYDNLKLLVNAVGKNHIVLDLSCRKKNNKYYIVTDRWQKFTDTILDNTTLDDLSQYCDEFLVHGVDVEGKGSGMEENLVKILAKWNKIPITYAGGIANLKQIEHFKQICEGKLDFTIGSALDIFGGNLSYDKVKKIYNISSSGDACK